MAMYAPQPPTRRALADELADDSAGLGYAALADAKNWNGIAEALNEPQRVGNVARRQIALPELSEAVVYSEFIALSQPNRDALLWLTTCMANHTLDPQDANVKAFLGGIFGAGTQTRTNLAALLTRSASRAESLWGDGVVITDTMVEAAARSK